MKQIIKLVVIMLSACTLFFSCNGNKNSSNGKDNSSSISAPSTESITSNSNGDASYSYTIDGKSYSGSGTNVGVNVAVVTNPGIISFDLGPLVSGTMSPAYGFYFKIPNTGTTVVREDDSQNDITYAPPNAGINTCTSKEMTAIITSSDGKRVSGTFSGTMTDRTTQKIVSVTDGKFDIPYSDAAKN